MNKKKKIWISLGGLITGLLLLLGLERAGRTITYLEAGQINVNDVSSVAIADNQTVLSQEFVMPYELFAQISIKTGTFGRNNNSFWRAEITERDSGKKVFSKSFNASQIRDGEYFELAVNKAKRVKPGVVYTVTIQSENATGNSALAFYTSGEDAYPGGRLYLNGEETEDDLCFQIYGAEKDVFWTGLYLALAAAVTGFCFYLFCLYRKGESIREDKLFQAVAAGVLYLALTYLFTRLNMGTFTDENDNIRGGMLIANGKVLYRDYYAQHTPFAYYLCAFFAFLGAGSIPQFRILYFLLNAVVWGGLYYRHSSYFGRIRMLLLPVAQVIIVMAMFFQSSKIMGDNIQGLCMIALTLEFLRYLEDKKLDAARSMIVAACIYISVMSAFVSVFALAPVVLGVIIMEILDWKGKTLKRYWKLTAACIMPFALTFVYFALNHAIRQFFQMAYQFNTIVYKNYQNEFGRVIWKPFFLGVKNYFTAITDNLNTLLTAAGNDTAVIQLTLALLSGVILALWAAGGERGKRILPAVSLFLCMTGNATRSSTDFHGAAFYNVAVTLILILGGELQIRWRKNAVIAATAAAVLYVSKPYVETIADHIVYKQDAVSGVDKSVIEMTKPGDLIFIDAYVHDSIYLMDKGRYPANRNCYILPWYMDWYEFDTIADLEEHRPAVAIFKPEIEVYGQTDFSPNLNQYIRSHYIREGEDSMVWKLK